MNTRVSIVLIASALFAGVAGAQSSHAVEWKVSEGGNGHWYERVGQSRGIDWASAKMAAAAIGGHLATISSAAENAFVHSVSNPTAWSSRYGPWLGGYQLPNSPEPSGGWVWVTGEPWEFTKWACGCGGSCCEPNNGCPTDPNESALHFIRDGVQGSSGWNDLSASGTCGSEGPVDQFMVEWDADCNSDGIVDYGQIRSGQLSDDNANGIPDICETSITGVIPPSVPAQGGAAISINGRNFPAQPTVLVGGVAATNVVRVSETRLTATTPALLPGMASVSVNGFTLADGIYIRPECGSDLDQDGEVTASDIAIVLLDFGPCYATATSSQPVDSTPFLLKEEPDSGTPGAR